MTETPATKPRVLIVTYIDVMAETWLMILNRVGFEASAVRTAEEMLEKAPDLRPDVIVSEILLDGMNGVEAAIRIREVLPSTRFLMFSGQAAAADVLVQARAQGYDFDVLALPIHPQDLLTKLWMLIDPQNALGKIPASPSDIQVRPAAAASRDIPPSMSARRSVWNFVSGLFRTR